MPWQPERIMANCQNYPDKAWCSRLPRHSPGGVGILILIGVMREEVIIHSYSCHVSQIVSCLTPIVHESRGTHTHYQIVSYYLVLDQVIATARLCHGSQSVSWLKKSAYVSRGTHTHAMAARAYHCYANCLWEQRYSYSLPERIIILSARSSHSNSQAMPWQPERIMANGQNYPDKAWCSRLPGHSPNTVIL